MRKSDEIVPNAIEDKLISNKVDPIKSETSLTWRDIVIYSAPFFESLIVSGVGMYPIHHYLGSVLTKAHIAAPGAIEFMVSLSVAALIVYPVEVVVKRVTGNYLLENVMVYVKRVRNTPVLTEEMAPLLINTNSNTYGTTTELLTAASSQAELANDSMNTNVVAVVIEDSKQVSTPTQAPSQKQLNNEEKVEDINSEVYRAEM